jgi:hypothetical protein
LAGGTAIGATIAGVATIGTDQGAIGGGTAGGATVIAIAGAGAIAGDIASRRCARHTRAPAAGLNFQRVHALGISNNLLLRLRLI